MEEAFSCVTPSTFIQPPVSEYKLLHKNSRFTVTRQKSMAQIHLLNELCELIVL